MNLQWSIQLSHTQLALDNVINLNYRNMHIWPPTKLDYITLKLFIWLHILHNIWSFWIITSHCEIDAWNFWHFNWWASLWLFGQHSSYFKSLSLFPTQILVCTTGFCSSISLFIWRFTFKELFLVKTKIKSGEIYRHKSMHVSRSTKTIH